MARLLYLAVFFICAQNALALYESGGDIVILTPDDFDTVKQSDDLWVVQFFAPWCPYCKKFVPKFEKAAAELKDIVKIGAMDADKYESFADKLGVESYPTIKIFGKDKNNPKTYDGENETKDLVEAVKKIANEEGLSHKSNIPQNNNNVELNDSNFDDIVVECNDAWLIQFYAPWCYYSKKLAPEWESAAKELIGKVKLGSIDADTNTKKAEEYNIDGFPVIKFFPAGKKDPKLAIEYEGKRNKEAIVSWVLDKLSEYEEPYSKRSCLNKENPSKKGKQRRRKRN